MELKVLHEGMVKAAAGTRPIVWGKALGPRPRFFLVGDEPIARDVLTGQPFSGVLTDVLNSAMITLEKQYGARPGDCYLTYMVKAKYQEGEMTEKIFMDEWIPAIQVEYQASGCEMVVAIGKWAKMFAHAIATKPKLLPEHEMTLGEKAKRIWQTLRA